MGQWRDEHDLLRHIRIGEYAMIDAAEKGMGPQEAVQDGEKRFWRVEERGQEPAVDYILIAGFLVVALYWLS